MRQAMQMMIVGFLALALVLPLGVVVQGAKHVRPVQPYGWTFDSVLGSEEDVGVGTVSWSNGSFTDSQVGWDRARKAGNPFTYPALMLERKPHWTALAGSWPGDVEFKKAVNSPDGTFAYLLTYGRTLYTLRWSDMAVTKVGDVARELDDLAFYASGQSALACGADEYIISVETGSTPTDPVQPHTIHAPLLNGYRLRSVSFNGQEQALIVGDLYTVYLYEATKDRLTAVSRNTEASSLEFMIDEIWSLILEKDKDDTTAGRFIEDSNAHHKNIHPVMNASGCWEIYIDGLHMTDPMFQFDNLQKIGVFVNVAGPATAVILGGAGAFAGGMSFGPYGALIGGAGGLIIGEAIGGVAGCALGIWYVAKNSGSSTAKLDESQWSRLDAVFNHGFTDIAWVDNDTADICGEGGFYRYELNGKGERDTYEINNDLFGLQDEVIQKRDFWSGPGLVESQWSMPMDLNYFSTLIYPYETSSGEDNYYVFANNGMFNHNVGWSKSSYQTLAGGITGRDAWDSNDPLAQDEEFRESLGGDKVFYMMGMDRRESDGKTFGTFLSYGVDSIRRGDVVSFTGDSLRLINTGAGCNVSDFKWSPDEKKGIALAGNDIMVYTEAEYAEEGSYDSLTFTVDGTGTIGKVLLTWAETTAGNTTVSASYRCTDGPEWYPIENGVAANPNVDYQRTTEQLLQSLQVRFELHGDGLHTSFVDNIWLEYWVWGPPVVTLNMPVNVNATEDGRYLTLSPLQFEAIIGQNSDGDELDPLEDMYFAWDMGDDHSGLSQRNEVNGSAVSQVHSYRYGGDYTATLRVGLKDYPDIYTEKTVEFHVENRAPVAVMDVVGTRGGPVNFTEGVHAGQAIDMTGAGSWDLDGNKLIQSYLWTWGDGETDTGSLGSHAYTEVGRYPITLTVEDCGDRDGSDPERNSTVGAISVYSGNCPPTPHLVQANYTVQFGKSVTIDASASDDAAGDQDWPGYQDDIVACHIRVISPANGTVIWEQNRTRTGYPLAFDTLTLTPDIDYAGQEYAIYVSVLDNDDGTDDGIVQPLWSASELCGWLDVTYFPASGDWVITAADGFVQVRDITGFMHGNIILQTGAHADFSGITLQMISANQNDVGIHVYAGATLEVNNGSVIQGIYAERTNMFSQPRSTLVYWLFWSRGTLSIENSTIQHVGWQACTNWFEIGQHINGITALSGSTLYMANSAVEHNLLCGVSVQTSVPTYIRDTSVSYAEDTYDVAPATSGTGAGVYGDSSAEIYLTRSWVKYCEIGVRVRDTLYAVDCVIDGVGDGILAEAAVMTATGTTVKTTTGLHLCTSNYNVQSCELIGRGGTGDDEAYSTGLHLYKSTGTFNNNTVYNQYRGVYVQDGQSTVTIKGTDFRRDSQEGNTYDVAVAAGSSVTVQNWMQFMVRLDGEPLAGANIRLYDDRVQVGQNQTSGADGLTGVLLVTDRVERNSGVVQVNNTWSADTKGIHVRYMVYNAYANRVIIIDLKTPAEVTVGGRLAEALGLDSSLGAWLPDSVIGILLMVLVFFVGVFLIAYDYYYAGGQHILQSGLFTVFGEAAIVTAYAGEWAVFVGCIIATVASVWWGLVNVGILEWPWDYIAKLRGEQA